MRIDQGGGVGKHAASHVAVTGVCDTVARGCGSGGSSSREAKMTSAGIKRERETPGGWRHFTRVPSRSISCLHTQPVARAGK